MCNAPGQNSNMPLANRRSEAYMMSLRAAWCVGPNFPGALPILKGAVPVPARGPEHTAPTYVVGSRDRNGLTAKAARNFPLPSSLIAAAAPVAGAWRA